MQVPGFEDSHSYSDVVDRACRALGIEESCTVNAQLIVSGGLVKNCALDNGENWSLGGYVQEIGGKAARGKKTFGVCVPETSPAPVCI